MNNPLNSYLTSGVGVSDTAVYTVPTGYNAALVGANIANTTTSTITVNIKLTRGATTVYILMGVIIPPNSGYVFSGTEQKLALLQGDILKVSSSAATSADVIVSVAELN